jgi:hypothetical protein
MIKVIKGENDSNTKVISTFIKRSKKANISARKRKIEFRPEKISQVAIKAKAIRTAEYIKNQEIIARTGKKTTKKK